MQLLARYLYLLLLPSSVLFARSHHASLYAYQKHRLERWGHKTFFHHRMVMRLQSEAHPLSYTSQKRRLERWGHKTFLHHRMVIRLQGEEHSPSLFGGVFTPPDLAKKKTEDPQDKLWRGIQAKCSANTSWKMFTQQLTKMGFTGMKQISILAEKPHIHLLLGLFAWLAYLLRKAYQERDILL